jgi:hypothetical protein
MLLSLCSDKPDAFGLAIGVEKVLERVLVSPGARFAVVASASTCVSMNRTSDGTPGEYPQAQGTQRHPQDL